MNTQTKEWQGNSDVEIAHIQADSILCDFLIELGFTELVNEYKKLINGMHRKNHG